MSALFIVNSTVTDMDKLQQYMAGVGSSMGTVPVKVLAVDNESEAVEGTPAGTRTVVVEFESKEDFKTWYDSPEYQAVLGLRLESTEGFALLVNGI